MIEFSRSSKPRAMLLCFTAILFSANFQLQARAEMDDEIAESPLGEMLQRISLARDRAFNKTTEMILEVRSEALKMNPPITLTRRQTALAMDILFAHYLHKFKTTAQVGADPSSIVWTETLPRYGNTFLMKLVAKSIEKDSGKSVHLFLKPEADQQNLVEKIISQIDNSSLVFLDNTSWLFKTLGPKQKANLVIDLKAALDKQAITRTVIFVDDGSYYLYELSPESRTRIDIFADGKSVLRSVCELNLTLQ